MTFRTSSEVNCITFRTLTGVTHCFVLKESEYVSLQKICSKLWRGNDTHSFTIIEYSGRSNIFFLYKINRFLHRGLKKIAEGKGRVCFRLLRRRRSLRELLTIKLSLSILSFPVASLLLPSDEVLELVMQIKVDATP